MYDFAMQIRGGEWISRNLLYNLVEEALLSVRLCRAPAGEEESFHDDIERIAVRFSVDADALAEAVRRGQALFHMTSGRNASATLLAARDGDRERGTDQRKRGSP
jgi:hypothetical protein